MISFEKRESPTLSQRAQAAAGIPVTKSKALRFDTAAADYPGVIASEGNRRVIVTPRGANYVAQILIAGQWSDAHGKAPIRDFLLQQLVGLDGDWPPPILAAVNRLPNDPEKCAFVPVPEKGIANV